MTCKICAHEDRASIDTAIVENTSLRGIAKQFGVSASAVDRHKKKHIPKALASAKRAEEVGGATTLLSRIERIVSRCETMFDRADAAGEWRAAASMAREIRGSLELLGKLSGELQSGGARIAITVAQIQTINIADLTKEQLGALYDRVQAERIREFAAMTDEELDREIGKFHADRGMELVPIGERPITMDRTL